MPDKHWWSGLLDWVRRGWGALSGVDKAKVEGVTQILERHLTRKADAAARSPDHELPPEELDAEVKGLVKELNLRPPKSK